MLPGWAISNSLNPTSGVYGTYGTHKLTNSQTQQLRKLTNSCANGMHFSMNARCNLCLTKCFNVFHSLFLSFIHSVFFVCLFLFIPFRHLEFSLLGKRDTCPFRPSMIQSTLECRCIMWYVSCCVFFTVNF